MMVASASRPRRGANARGLLLLESLAGILIGFSLVAINLGSGEVADHASTSAADIPVRNRTVISPGSEPEAIAATAFRGCSIRSTTVPGAVPSSEAGSAADRTPIAARSAAGNRDDAMAKYAPDALAKRPFDARDWLYITGMSVRHRPSKLHAG
jgi:hypothetical protein